MTRWSVRILFASALVLVFVGGEWHGRRDGDRRAESMREGLRFFEDIAAGVAADRTECEARLPPCDTNAGDSVSFDSNSDHVVVTRGGKVICKGRGIKGHEIDEATVRAMARRLGVDWPGGTP